VAGLLLMLDVGYTLIGFARGGGGWLWCIGADATREFDDWPLILPSADIMGAM